MRLGIPVPKLLHPISYIGETGAKLAL